MRSLIRNEADELQKNGFEMAALTKRTKEFVKIVDKKKALKLKDAVELLKTAPKTKFDQTVQVSFRLNVNVKEASVSVRGSVSLPHGTGKSVRVAVFCKGEFEKKALDAGADHAGASELINKVAAGWYDFDVAIATPDMMRDLSKLGKVLGPRGLMPNPKAGTVTMDIENTVKEVKKGKIEFKMDKQSNIHAAIGKLSFPTEKLCDNGAALIDAVFAAKPATVRGVFVKGMSLSSTMGPGVKLDPNNWR